jgi:hypothetical protein
VGRLRPKPVNRKVHIYGLFDISTRIPCKNGSQGKFYLRPTGYNLGDVSGELWAPAEGLRPDFDDRLFVGHLG